MSSIRARSAYRSRSAAVISGLSRCRMTNPSPGSCLGGRGRRGEATVPTGAALTTTTRRAPAARGRQGRGLRGGQVGPDRAHLGGEGGRVACYRGDVVPGREGLADEVAADAAGGGEDGELHLVVRSPRASASNSSTGQWSSVHFP